MKPQKEVTHEEIVASLNRARREAHVSRKVAPKSEPAPDEEDKYKGFDTEEELVAAVEQVTAPFDTSVLDPEEAAIFDGKVVEKEEDKVAPADTPMPPEFTLPTTSDSLDFTLDFDTFGKVDVQEYERDLYMKSLLNDTPYQLAVEVIPGFSAIVRSRTVFYDDLIYDIMRTAEARGEVLGLESGFTKLMRLLAGVQIISINGHNVEFETEKTTRAEVAKELLDHVENTFRNYSLQKWNALVKAVRIFDAKLKVCNDKLMDRTFWEGANTN